ncbi:phytolongin Phyl2.2 [Vicia villosa]|uniref:phytolongin Phyl2.2 n=1 Tax=Vicia villosa TaxID=3911 RepID=UPI00273CA147|nr:phytolongin Phyl2.2 [Vicia villosa]
MGAASMIWNPDLIHYLCIAKSTTILAHHIKNSKDSSTIETLASKCLENSPPNHSFFSHTVNNRTYTFLIAPPFVLFAIFDHQLLKPHALAFLNRIKSSLIEALDKNDNFTPFSLQPQFDSVLNETLSFYDLSSNPGSSVMSPTTSRTLLVKPDEGLKKKKRIVDDGKEAAMVDLSSDDNSSLPFSKINDRQKAKRVWKKHVWVVLMLDLFVCAVLFVIWLWVCSGFKCMAY